ncbi:MAG: haloacid dehalogenase type II [Chloroflexia bacterium]|nr:haloacid dehalogenase type II [Chloroflexia bacterium]
MTDGDIRVATFDCYGTLIDWEGGAAGFLANLCLRDDDPSPGPGRLLRERWEAIQFEIIQERYQPYKAILAESLRTWVAERGLPWDEADGEALARSMRSWQPFPDTRPALSQVREAGVRLVILSNTDRDIISHSLRQLEVPFDDVITAEECGSYKPDERNFAALADRVGLPPEQILHVAAGYAYDVQPAHRLGFRTAWVNRHVEAVPGAATPDYQWRDLWGLTALAGGPGPGI